MRLIDVDALPIKFWGDRFVVVAKVDVENAPTVDAVKHGHWVMSNGDYEWECSSCGCGLTNNRTAYCHDCGAKMDEVTE